MRADKETINNALHKSLPEFLNFYKGITTEKILTEAYHSLRGSTTTSFVSDIPNLDPQKESKIIVIDEVEILKEELKIEKIRSTEIIKEVKGITKKSEDVKAVVSKFNKKGTLREFYKKNISYEDAIKTISETHGIVIDKFYAKSAYQDFVKELTP